VDHHEVARRVGGHTAVADVEVRGTPGHHTRFTDLNAFEYLRYGYASAATVAMLVVTASILWLQYRIVIRWRGRFVPAP
jgi:hypothetical protein